MKPAFFFDEDLTKLPHTVRLLFIGMWGLADKEGRMEDRPAFIRANVFPYEPDVDVESGLATLAPKFIERYVVDGRGFIWIRNFRRHQRINGKEADTESAFPVAPGEAMGKQPRSNGEATEKHLGSKGDETGAQEEEVEGERGKGSGRGKGKDKAATPAAPLVPKDLQESMSEITDWLAYKREKGQTYKGPKGLEALWRMIRAIPVGQRRAAVDHSMANNYSGLFMPKGGTNGKTRTQTGSGTPGARPVVVDPGRSEQLRRVGRDVVVPEV